MSINQDIVFGHLDDEVSTAELVVLLGLLHGGGYAFGGEQWEGERRVEAVLGTVVHLFMAEMSDALIRLYPGELVRGPSLEGPYRIVGVTGKLLDIFTEALWPGDTVCVDATTANRSLITVHCNCLKVVAEATGYAFPRLVLLRNLPDISGGCGSYDGAFRRPALPPQPVMSTIVDRRGQNRVNQHYFGYAS